MDGHGRDVLGNAGAQCDDAADVRGVGGLRDAAEDHFVDERGVQTGALEEIRHGDAAQFHGVEAREVGAGLAERRPDSIDDDEAWLHAAFSISSERRSPTRLVGVVSVERAGPEAGAPMER